MNIPLFGRFLDIWNVLTRNPTTGALESGGVAIDITGRVDTWAELQSIPKTPANDGLILQVSELDYSQSLYQLNYTDQLWHSIQGPPSVANSIMWLGNSLVALANGVAHPLTTSRKPYFRPFPAYTNLNAVSTFVVGTRAGHACLASATTGTLTYTRSTRTLTWTAPGDSAGTPVSVIDKCWVRLESASANMELCLTLLPANEPLLDRTDTFNLNGLISAVTYGSLNAVPAMYNALRGNPFGENQLWYCGSSFTTQVFITALEQWKDVHSDITVIDLGTNEARTDLATCDAALAQLQTIIEMRKSIGSRVLVSLINLANTYSDTITKLLVYWNAKVKAMSYTVGFETFDGNPWLCAANGTLASPGRTTCYSVADNLHLSVEGSYVKTKYALAPCLDKYAPKHATLHNPIIPYDATYAPQGNLLTNGQLLGTAGAKGGTGAARITGNVPSSNTLLIPLAGNLACTTTCPDDGGAVARTDGKPGFYWRMEINNATGSADEYISIFQTTAISSGNYAAGDSVIISGDYRISGSGISGAQILVTTTGSGQTYAVYRQGANVDTGSINGETVTFEFESWPLTLLAGISTLNFSIVVIMAAGGSCTFDLGQNLCLRKVA